MQEHGIPAAVVTKFLSSRRIEIEKTGLYSFLVLFSMGITKGKWSTLITELINFKDLYDANAPMNARCPLCSRPIQPLMAIWGLKTFASSASDSISTTMSPRHRGKCTQHCRRWRCGLPMPMRSLVRGRVESVEIDNLMGRTLAVMVVPYPPGIPLIMPGERITDATKSIYDYLLYAREFDRKFPGFETDIHGLRFESTGRRRYLVDCIMQGRRAMIPRDVKSPTAPIPFHKLLKSRRNRRSRRRTRRKNFSTISQQKISKSNCATTYERDVSEDASVGAYIALVDGDRLEHARKLARSVRDLGFQTPLWALADSHRISDIARCRPRARSMATSISGSRPPLSMPSKSSPA